MPGRRGVREPGSTRDIYRDDPERAPFASIASATSVSSHLSRASRVSRPSVEEELEPGSARSLEETRAGFMLLDL